MRSPELLHLVSLLFFGFNGVTAAYIDLASEDIVLMRLLLGVLFLLPFALHVVKGVRLSHHDGFHACAAGLFMGASWIFLYSAYRSIGVALASVIYYFGPVLVMIVTACLHTEYIRPAQWLCLVVAFSGLLLSISDGRAWRQDIEGLIKASASAVCYAGMILCARGIRNPRGFVSAFVILAAALASVGIYFLLTGTTLPSFEAIGASLLPLLVLGVVNTGLSCLLYFQAVPKLSAATVSIVGYAEPLTAVVAATLLLSETLTACQILGIALLFSGAAAAQLLGRR